MKFFLFTACFMMYCIHNSTEIIATRRILDAFRTALEQHRNKTDSTSNTFSKPIAATTLPVIKTTTTVATTTIHTTLTTPKNLISQCTKFCARNSADGQYKISKCGWIQNKFTCFYCRHILDCGIKRQTAFER